MPSSLDPKWRIHMQIPKRSLGATTLFCDLHGIPRGHAGGLQTDLLGGSSIGWKIWLVPQPRHPSVRCMGAAAAGGLGMRHNITHISLEALATCPSISMMPRTAVLSLPHVCVGAGIRLPLIPDCGQAIWPRRTHKTRRAVPLVREEGEPQQERNSSDGLTVLLAGVHNLVDNRALSTARILTRDSAQKGRKYRQQSARLLRFRGKPSGKYSNGLRIEAEDAGPLALGPLI
jgi:hypothetical protein